jgi:cytochrome c oxidase subunit 1
MSESMGKIHFWITFIGVYAIFMPMHYLGLVGHPRRYSELSGVNFLGPLIDVHTFISIAAFIVAAGQLIFIFNLFWSMRKGAKASANPWEATTLEWTVPSPPPFDNFAGKHPVVRHDPYEYGVPGARQDYIMQDSMETVKQDTTARK